MIHYPLIKCPAVVIAAATEQFPKTGETYYIVTLMLTDCEYHGKRVVDKFFVFSPEPIWADVQRDNLLELIMALGIHKTTIDESDLLGITVDVEICIIGERWVVQRYVSRAKDRT